jgi:hypothetical protein
MFETGALCGAVNHELHGAGSERGAPLRGKYIIACGMRILAAQTAKRADLKPAQPMVAVQSILRNVERSLGDG